MRDTQSYYDHFAATYEDGRESRYHRYLDDAELGCVAPHVAGRDVLEVGCGTGLILERLAAVARRAEGVDLSPGMLDKAKARGLSVQVADATNLPFDDETFDAACSFKVLAHVPSLNAALREMARVVKPGGVVVAEVYNAQSLRTLVKRLKRPTAIGIGGVNDEDVYTRYDSRADVAKALPPTLRIERVDGIRVATPVTTLMELPGLGPVWTRLEARLSRSALKRFGGFAVYTLRRV